MSDMSMGMTPVVLVEQRRPGFFSRMAAAIGRTWAGVKHYTRIGWTWLSAKSVRTAVMIGHGGRIGVSWTFEALSRTGLFLLRSVNALADGVVYLVVAGVVACVSTAFSIGVATRRIFQPEYWPEEADEPEVEDDPEAQRKNEIDQGTLAVTNYLVEHHDWMRKERADVQELVDGAMSRSLLGDSMGRLLFLDAIQADHAVVYDDQKAMIAWGSAFMRLKRSGSLSTSLRNKRGVTPDQNKARKGWEKERKKIYGMVNSAAEAIEEVYTSSDGHPG